MAMAMASPEPLRMPLLPARRAGRRGRRRMRNWAVGALTVMAGLPMAVGVVLGVLANQTEPLVLGCAASGLLALLVMLVIYWRERRRRRRMY
jgi:hypothetical protein